MRGVEECIIQHMLVSLLPMIRTGKEAPMDQQQRGAEQVVCLRAAEGSL
jgi:hypothetical protein